MQALWEEEGWCRSEDNPVQYDLVGYRHCTQDYWYNLVPNVQADDNYCTLSRWGSPQQDVLVDNNCCTAMLWESLLPAQHNPWLDVQAFHSCCRLAHSGTRLRCVLASCSSGIMAPLDMLQQYACKNTTIKTSIFLIVNIMNQQMQHH